MVSDLEEPTGEPPARLVRPLPDVDLYIGGNARAFALADWFERTPTADTLRFAAAGGDGIVHLRFDADRLTLTPTNPGSTEVVVSASDSQGNAVADTLEVTVSATEPVIAAYKPLPDIEMYLNDASRSIDLKYWFKSIDAGTLSFSAEGGNVSVRIALRDAHLTLYPDGIGSTEVAIKVTGSIGGQAADTFSVTVAAPCPAPVDPATDFFPVAEGDVWTFDMETGQCCDRMPGEHRNVGRATWRFTEVACRAGAGALSVTETFAGRNERRSYSDDPWIPTGDSVYHERTLSFLRADSLDLDNYTVRPIPAARSMAEPDTARTWQGTGYRGGFKEQTLVRGRGLVTFRYLQNASAGGLTHFTYLYRIDDQ